MKSLIRFVHRPDLDLSAVFIILHKYGGVVDESPLDRAARFCPWLLFVVNLESYSENNHFVNVNASVALFFNSVQVSRTTRCNNFQRDFPNSKPKFIISRNKHIIWSVDNQGRGIRKTQPERGTSQVKQRAFARSEITFNWVLLI